MKFLIGLLLLIPTLIAVLLFTVAGLSFGNPAMLAASSNPSIAVCCIIAGVIALLPLIVAVVIWLINVASSSKTKNKNQSDTVHKG